MPTKRDIAETVQVTLEESARSAYRRIRELEAALEPLASVALLQDGDMEAPDEIDLHYLLATPVVTPDQVRQARKVLGEC